jgi:hypothetical protein
MNYPPIKRNFPISINPNPSKYKYSAFVLFFILVSISILGVLLSSRSKEMFNIMEKFGDERSYTEQNFNSKTYELLGTTSDVNLIPQQQQDKTKKNNNFFNNIFGST